MPAFGAKQTFLPRVCLWPIAVGLLVGPLELKADFHRLVRHMAIRPIAGIQPLSHPLQLSSYQLGHPLLRSVLSWKGRVGQPRS